MGGCRCSYKNCKIKSDGKTHMFHYPVFDKLRCHKWITNAQKMEFLNLKVSQLRNRVVCQHHFTDNCFMNFKKDKLTFGAIPTEDGPYCDTSQLANIKSEKDSGIYIITLEDIDDLSFIDKKANFSVKYGDFLTNCDLMDTNVTDNSDSTTKDKQPEASSVVNENFQMLYPSVGKIEVEVETFDNVSAEPQKLSCVNKSNNVITSHNQGVLKEDSKKDKKIVIISEKKITDAVKIPLPSPSNLKSISTTTVLPLPEKRNVILNGAPDQIAIKSGNHLSFPVENNLSKINVPAPKENKILNNNVCPLTFGTDVPKLNQQTIEKGPGPIKQCKVNHSPVNTLQNNIASKTKYSKSVINKPTSLTPERRALIQEKRQFNMKLRDIIETCLDNLDDEEKIPRENKSSVDNKPSVDPEHEYKLNEIDNSKSNNKKNNEVSHLSSTAKKKSIQEYAVTYLEAKMKKMEENLINRIDQNTKRIIELKNEFIKAPYTKNYQPQTVMAEEARKRHLYQELSKYLSTDASSLIYEELFINKFVRTTTEVRTPSVKRRRQR